MKDILIKSLAYNYLIKKYNQDVSKNIKSLYSNINENKIESLSDEEFLKVDKIIVITGAGLSSEAGFPLGWDTAVELMDDLVEQKLVSQKYLDYKIEKLRLENNQAQPDFETILEVLSEHKNLEERVKVKLAEIFELRNCPTLGYEILAHWLRHRVIDGVINFNFDELLDEAIEEEFVHSEYIKVIAGGDYADRRLNIDINETIDYPIYIKPHGTISDKDSLRATRDHYLRTTTGFQDVLKKLLKGNILFLCVGYNMQSIELNQLFIDQMLLIEQEEKGIYPLKPNFFLLKETEPEKSGFPLIDDKITHLKPEYFSEDFGSIFLKKINTELTKKLKQETKKRLKENRESNQINYQLDKLKVYPLKDILRHEITCELFSSNLKHIKNEKKNKYEIHVYNYVRMLVDLGITLAKSGGVINIFALNSGRFGRLYSKYYSTSSRKYPLVEICKKLDLTKASYTSELWTVLPVIEGSLNPKPNNKGENIKYIEYWKDNFKLDFERSIIKYEKNMIEHLNQEIRSIVGSKINNKKYREIQLKLLDKLIDKFTKINFSKKLLIYGSESSYEIGHPLKNGTNLVYQDDVVKKLHSWGHMRFEFNNLVQNYIDFEENNTAKYQILYCTTHGRYFEQDWTKKIIRDLRKKLGGRIDFKILLRDLPESQYYHNNEIEGFLEDETFTLNYMNWWTNNRNLIIILKKEFKDGKDEKQFIPQAAIYFYRGSTTRRVSPISISRNNEIDISSLKIEKIKLEEKILLQRESNSHSVLEKDYNDLEREINDINIEVKKREHLEIYYNIFKEYLKKSENRKIIKNHYDELQ